MGGGFIILCYLRDTGVTELATLPGKWRTDKRVRRCEEPIQAFVSLEMSTIWNFRGKPTQSEVLNSHKVVNNIYIYIYIYIYYILIFLLLPSDSLQFVTKLAPQSIKYTYDFQYFYLIKPLVFKYF
jgi:hypothetical protein